SRGMLNLNGTFTIEAWVRWNTEYSGHLSLVDDLAWPGMNREVQVAEHCGLVLRTSKLVDANKRSLEIAFVATEAGKTDWLSDTSQPRKDTDSKEWHHVAVSKTPAAVALYWNGKLVARRPCQGVQFHNCPTNLFVGVRKNPSEESNESWKEIRGVRISKKARYTRDFKPDKAFSRDDTTLVLLDFNTTDEKKVHEISGNKHDGAIVGAKWVDVK